MENTAITIDNVKEEKRKLEQSILLQIKDFERENDLEIKDLHLEFIKNTRLKTRVSHVSLKVSF
ncbi:hypothetical protein J0871_16800 [Salegentibacter sp. BDJ18]|uniref:hypothetical protein n=1 Tax=Salegentibacter sp. BDJ18 TaxID=2816376 RepID=UPI001AAF9D6B|nr:hypothetical protein [Salegentibacter sp. BDJ18]MBO2546078.1 hypothetical protein [Salegentibacter sp. BDJ18]